MAEETDLFSSEEDSLKEEKETKMEDVEMEEKEDEELEADTLPQLTKRYYKISEVAEMMGVEESALRFWEKEFAVLGKEYIVTRVGARIRKYNKEQIEHIRTIKYLLKDKKMQIAGAIDYIKQSKKRNPKERAITTLIDVRNELQSMLEAYEFIIARDNFQEW